MAKMTRLASLTLNSFRGASQRVTIPFSEKAITLLFGENGSGKSSIIDGLEFVLKGTPGSIGDISGASPSSHLPTLNAKPKDIFVEAKLNDDSLFRAKLEGRDIKITAEGSSPCPNVSFLRRSIILNLITAKPGDRYAALAAFINVSGVESAETSLCQAINDQKRCLDSATSKVRTSSEELQRLFTEHASADEKTLQFEQWSAKYASEDIADLKKTVDSLASIIIKYNSANEALADADSQRTLWNTKHEDQEKAEKAYVEIIKTAPGAIDLLIGLLTTGKAYVEAVKDEIEICPLCANRTSRSLLTKNIEAKLSKLPGVQDAKEKKDEAEAAYRLQGDIARTSYLRLLRSTHRLYKTLDKLPIEHQKDFDPKNPAFSAFCSLPENITKEFVTKDSMTSARTLLSKISDVISKLKVEHDKLEPRKTLLSSIQTHYQALMDGRKEAKTVERVRDHMQSMLDAIRPIRQNFVQATLRSVASDCDQLYAEMHPDEPLGGIQLMLDTAKRSSCNITGEFCGKKDVPPQAYYSESHMDTLGFALFISLAKRGACSDTVIILDDIFTSVDEQHLERVCKLLAAEATTFRQVIIATHIRKIYEWVGTVLPENTYGVVRLASKWSLQDGIHAQFAIPTREEIKQLLDDRFLDRTALAGKSRRYLEAIIRGLVYTIGATGPMKKNDDHELSDYLCGLQSLAKEGWQVVRKFPAPSLAYAPSMNDNFDLRTRVKELNKSKVVVNKLIHATEEGASYTDEEVREFAREVLALDKYLRCDDPNCGSLVGTNKRFVSCSCGAVKCEKRPL